MTGNMQILETPEQVVAWLRKQVADKAELSADSRAINSGDVFIAYMGYASDGRKYLAQAFAAGAKACVVDAEGAEAFALNAQCIGIANLKMRAGEIASLFYGEPSRKLDVIAVTGTNGKTTVTNWIAQSLNKLHIPCAVIGTLGFLYADLSIDTGMTTPDSVQFQRFMNQVLKQGAKAIAVEASSIGIEEGRMNGAHIHTAVFTNLTQDHLDYHGDMQRYAAAKRKLFAWPELKHAVLNAADAHGAQWAAQLKNQNQFSTTTFSATGDADWAATNLQVRETGLGFHVRHANDQGDVRTQFIGQHNVENFLAVLAVVHQYTQSFSTSLRVCESVQSVSGRLELIHTQGAPLAVVDYAHTPDALEKALQALRPTSAQRHGKLIALFGCGGDRDKTKRPLMARAAEQGADEVVITSDNPRTERAEQILQDIAAGLTKPASLMEIDRRQAIHRTIAGSAKDDVILIAGKGHEDYQIIGTDKFPFSDQAEARAAQQAYVQQRVAA